jgi:phosphate transport system permease protein
MNDVGAKARVRADSGYESRRVAGTDIAARGEPALWMLGGTLALGVLMIVGFLILIVWNGALAFWPRPIELVQLASGKVIAGEPRRTESFRPSEGVVSSLPQTQQTAIEAAGGFAERTLYRIGNYDLYNEDFVWIPDYERAAVSLPRDIMLF